MQACFWHLAIPIALAVTVATKPADPTPLFKSLVAAFLRSDSPKSLSILHRTLLTRASESEIGELIAHSDVTLALATGWERVRRTIPKAKESSDTPVDKLALARFIGLVEGRACISLPLMWTQGLLTASAGWRPGELPRIGFTTENQRRQEDFENEPSRPEPQEFRPAGATQPACEEHDCVVTQGSANWRLPYDPGRDGSIDKAIVKSTGELAFVTMYPDYPVETFPLFALDAKTGHIRWSAKVWVQELYGGFSGNAENQVELVVRNEEVLVFGVTYDAAYAASYDRKTGKIRWRFSSAFWDYDLGQ